MVVVDGLHPLIVSGWRAWTHTNCIFSHLHTVVEFQVHRIVLRLDQRFCLSQYPPATSDIRLGYPYLWNSEVSLCPSNKTMFGQPDNIFRSMNRHWDKTQSDWIFWWLIFACKNVSGFQDITNWMHSNLVPSILGDRRKIYRLHLRYRIVDQTS